MSTQGIGQHLYDKLQEHLGHDVQVVGYGLLASSADPVNISLECDQCGSVIFDTDVYDLVGLEPAGPLTSQQAHAAIDQTLGVCTGEHTNPDEVNQHFLRQRAHAALDRAAGSQA